MDSISLGDGLIPIIVRFLLIHLETGFWRVYRAIIAMRNTKSAGLGIAGAITFYCPSEERSLRRSRPLGRQV